MTDVQAHCKGCGAPIVWSILNGRPHPVEITLKTIIVDGKLVSGPESHFAHCPAAARFRKREPSSK